MFINEFTSYFHELFNRRRGFSRLSIPKDETEQKIQYTQPSKDLLWIIKGISRDEAIIIWIKKQRGS
jgi:hypothetical protein